MATKMTCPVNKETVRAAKEAVRLVGFGLGNLMYRIYRGEIHKSDWNATDRENAKGTDVFLLGGSICTNGYTQQLLPLIAQRQLLSIDPDFAGKVRIFTPYMESGHAGAFGAYFMALTEHVRKELRSKAEDIYARNKVPILPLIDIGGTKVNLVLAYLDQEGELTLDILESHRYVTPISEPEVFYPRLASLLAAPLAAIRSNDLFELIPVLAVGQPGRFEDPKGEIGIGTAKDLGPKFPGCVPSKLLARSLQPDFGDIDVYCANDGRCQFLGIGVLGRKSELQRWKDLHDHKVAYLGLGTGLGAGFGKIDKDGYVKPFSMHNAFDILADKKLEELPASEHVAKPVLSMPYQYGDLLSGKFFRKFMRDVDLTRFDNGQPTLFLACSSAGCLIGQRTQERALLAADVRISPLNAVLLNEILAEEVVTAKTEEIVERSRQELERELYRTLDIMADELGKTLRDNVRGCAYADVIEQVACVKRRGRRVQFIGIGKSHSIGRDLAYIYNNLGIDSASCELTGANSENLTNLHEDDLVFLISNSGHAAELLQLVPYIHRKRCLTVALTGDKTSPLADWCSYFVNTHVNVNPHPIPEAPTTSTMSALAAGTAIGMVVSYLFDYDANDFFLDHPNLQFNVEFPVSGVRADAAFDRLTKVEDIFQRFAASIGGLRDDHEFVPTMISLTQRILASHYNGRTIFFTGAGASLRVAEKIAATLTSIGIDASAVNSAQLPHGDFAHIRHGDLLVIISFSGETRQLLHIHEVAQDKKVDCVVITAKRNSSLARKSPPGLCLIAGEGADDTDLCAIPDQKLLSSFINLTVGDALAVILGQVLGRTTQDFMYEGHRGGVAARAQARLDDKLLSELGEDLAHQIASNPEKLAEINNPPAGKVAIPVTGEHLISYDRRSSGPSVGSEVMIFGMGGIGLAYLAPIFSKLGKKILFVEKDRERIRTMQQVGFRYDVRCVGDCEECMANIAIGRVSVISSEERDSITANALRVDTIFTAVGVDNVKSLLETIADIIIVRYQFRVEVPLNIVFSENFPVVENPLAHNRHRLREMLASPELKVYFDRFVGLVPAIDEAVVPEVKTESLKNPIFIEANCAVLFVDRRQWCYRSKRDHKEEPNFGNQFAFTESFLPLHMRKLWVHNMAHAIIGYLGYFSGHQFVYDAVMDQKIKELTIRAMRAVGHELYRRWSYRETKQPTLAKYISWRWERYCNKALKDPVTRLCRDPERKLKRDDRLVGAANYLRRYAGRTKETDQAIVDILTGVVAAIHYAEKNIGTNPEVLYAQVTRDLVNIDSELMNRAKAAFRMFCH
jgi:mannitol-1-phosphate 5-dehydrogenase